MCRCVCVFVIYLDISCVVVSVDFQPAAKVNALRFSIFRATRKSHVTQRSALIFAVGRKQADRKVNNKIIADDVSFRRRAKVCN